MKIKEIVTVKEGYLDVQGENNATNICRAWITFYSYLKEITNTPLNIRSRGYGFLDRWLASRGYLNANLPFWSSDLIDCI